MFRESQAMRELHEIREQIYEETKNMPSADKIKYLYINLMTLGRRE